MLCVHAQHDNKKRGLTLFWGAARSARTGQPCSDCFDRRFVLVASWRRPIRGPQPLFRRSFLVPWLGIGPLISSYFI